MTEVEIAKYLQSNVGDVLSEAYASLAQHRPADAVEFLGMYLKQYAAKGLHDEDKKALDAYRKEVQVEKVENQAIVDARAQALQDVDDAHKALVEKLEGLESWSDGVWDEILGCVKAAMDAHDGYFGKMIEGEEEQELEYFKGPEGVVNTSLKASEGVTHKIWEEQEAPDEEDAEAVANWKKFVHLYVPCATDDPNIKFYTWTKLGAYAALPWAHDGYHTQEALAAALANETALAEHQEGDEAPEPQELPPTEVRLAVGVDSLGTNLPLNLAKIESLYRLVKVAAEAKSRIEKKEIQKQATHLVPQLFAEAKGEFEAAAGTPSEETVDGKIAEWREANPDKEVTDSAKAVFEAQIAYNSATQAALASKDAMLSLLDFVVVNENLTNLVLAAMYLVGVKESEVQGGVQLQVQWAKIVELIPNLVKKIETINLAAKRTKLTEEQKFAAIEGLKPSEFEPEAILEAGGLGLQVLDHWVNAALALRGAYLENKRAEFTQQEAEYQAAQAATAEWEEAEQAAEEARANGEDPGERPAKPDMPTAPQQLKFVDDDFVPPPAKEE